MKPFVLLVGVMLGCLFFAGGVQSSHYRGGTITYKPNAASPYSVDFTFRLSFRRGSVYCDESRVASRSLASTSFSNTWKVTRYGSYYSSSSSGSANMYCSNFNAEEDWSEGNNTFTYVGSHRDDWWNVRITDSGNWINGITHSNPNDYMQLEARVNRTVNGAFNNSSPVTSLPLTVYVIQGIPSIIIIPVEDRDGDIVRCRYASYQECYRGMCTYFPYGALDEGNCILSYNGGGYLNQLFPIILKLEDFPSGTTQFDSSNSLGSVDLQFVVHLVNSTGLYSCNSNPCRNRGTCYNGNDGTYICSCPRGYTGQQCQTNMPCTSDPCRNGATCHNYYWYNGGYYCSCPYGYTGQQCQTYLNWCASGPCRNGGTCNNAYYRYQCSCSYGFTGRQCETNLKTSVTCGENFMQIDLRDQYFPGLNWRSLHLKNTSCTATKTAYTMRLRAPLDGCGVTYVEHDKKITFWNEVRNEQSVWPSWGGNLSAITRGENLLIPFYCEYGREKIVSTSFNPSRKLVYASEGSYGNFTFTMDLYQTSRYSTPYSPFAYPVVVYPNQPLWVQYEVKNTNADLVVFAENCRATTSTNPDSFPQHVFLERGCTRDPTMVYWYNPYSNAQRFSIRSFSFVYSNTFLVYLHCELIVCHRNSTNSRCAQGCISSRRRREAVDGSNKHDLSVGPLKGPNAQTGTDEQGGEETSSANTATIGSVSTVGAVALLVAILLSVKMFHNRRNRVPPKETPPPAIVMNQTVNSYEQHVMEDGERTEIEI